MASVQPGSTLVYVTDVTYAGEWVDDVWVAQMQIIGRRRDHRSVVVRVGGFWPYFYCNRHNRPNSEARHDLDALQTELERHLELTADALDDAEAQRITRGLRGRAGGSGEARRIRGTLVRVSHARGTPVMGYQPKRDLFKIEVSHPNAVAKLRDHILTNTAVPALTVDDDGRAQAYEANVEFVIRFMVDHGVRCNAWIEVDAKAEMWNDSSYCTSPDLFVESPQMIRAISDEVENQLGLTFWLVLMSFDIECAAPLGSFPDPERDPVIQIACDMTTLDGSSNAEVESGARAILLALDKQYPDSVGEDTSTDPDAVGSEVDVRQFRTEADLLIHFAQLVRTEDPDVITGWNTPNFDWRYIINRCRVLGLPDEATHFSRLHNRKTFNRDIKQATKAHGHKEDNQVDIPGRVVFDMMDPVRVNYKLRSYKLDDVAYEFLKERKDDVPHTEITKKWNGTPYDRGILGKYWYVFIARVLFSGVSTEEGRGERGSRMKKCGLLFRRSLRGVSMGWVGVFEVGKDPSFFAALPPILSEQCARGRFLAVDSMRVVILFLGPPPIFYISHPLRHILQ